MRLAIDAPPATSEPTTTMFERAITLQDQLRNYSSDFTLLSTALFSSNASHEIAHLRIDELESVDDDVNPTPGPAPAKRS
jgi:hypothetical protein